MNTFAYQPAHRPVAMQVERCPKWLLALIFVTMATGFFVLVEPAPYDLLLMATIAVAMLLRQPIVSCRASTMAYAGLALYFTANCISAVFVIDVAAAVKSSIVTGYLVVGWLVMVAWIARYGEITAQWIVRGYVVAAAVAALIGCLARFKVLPGSDLFLMGEERVKSTFKDPNVFAPFVVGGIVLMLSHVISNGRRPVLSWLYIAMCSSAVVFSFSRGALIHLAVSTVVLALLYLVVIRNRTATRRLLLVGLFTLASLPLIAFYALVKLDMWAFFNERLAYQSYDNSRFGTQAKAVQLSMDAPWGIGPGQWTLERFDVDTHSLYVNVLVENGVLGLAGMLLFIVGCLLSGFSAVRRRDALSPLAAAALAVCAGALLEAFVIDTLHWRHLFVFLALCAGLNAYARCKQEDDTVLVSQAGNATPCVLSE